MVDRQHLAYQLIILCNEMREGKGLELRRYVEGDMSEDEAVGIFEGRGTSYRGRSWGMNGMMKATGVIDDRAGNVMTRRAIDNDEYTADEMVDEEEEDGTESVEEDEELIWSEDENENVVMEELHYCCTLTIQVTSTLLRELR